MLMPMRIKKSRTSLFSFFAAILMLSSLFASAIAPLTGHGRVPPVGGRAARAGARVTAVAAAARRGRRTGTALGGAARVRDRPAHLHPQLPAVRR